MNIGSLLALLGIMSFIIALKIMICSCYMRYQQRRADDRRPILDEDDRTHRLYELHQARIRSRRAREQPPTFEDALRNSRPVSHIDIEEPPPTYDEYIKNSDENETHLDYSPSINPSDIVINVDRNSENGVTL